MLKCNHLLSSVIVVAGFACGEAATSPSPDNTTNVAMSSGGLANTGGQPSAPVNSSSGGQPSPASGGEPAQTPMGGSAGNVSAGGSPGGSLNSGGANFGGEPQMGGTPNNGGEAQGGNPSAGAAGAPAAVVPEVPPSKIVGWATEGGGTTGGGDKTPIMVTTLADLKKEAGGSEPKVIHVSGKFSGGVKVGSNKTIIGMPGTVLDSGGNALNLGGSNNVIVKNITFIGKPDGGADTAQISGGSNIWLDHLEFVDGGDGMLDIVNGSNYITVSWCKMRYTKQTGHQNAALLGNSDGANDSGKIRVSFHHNWWAENIAERQPRVRFGQVHIFNNLYVATPGFTTYAIRAAYKANVLSEKNIFRDFTGISKAASDAKSSEGECFPFSYTFSRGESVLETVDDLFINCTERGIDADGEEGGTFGRGDAFDPPYEYTLGETATLEALIRKGAGPTLTP